MPQTWFSKNAMWSQNSFSSYADFIFSSLSSPLPPHLPHFHPLLALLFPNIFPWKYVMQPPQQLLKLQKNLPENPPRKHLLPPPLPEREKRRNPRKSFISGLSKGFGGRRNRKETGRGRRKAKGYSLAGKGLERRGRKTEKEGKKRALRGGRHPARPWLLLIFSSAAGKIKICGEENLVLQEHIRYSFTISAQEASYPFLKSSLLPLLAPPSIS